MNETTKQYWNDCSDEYYKSCYRDSILDTIQNDPSHAFPAETFEMIKRVFPDLRGKRVLVASSGDNVAVFGFHLLGADVTSTDLSERQLENAAKLATTRGWNIKFACADSMTLTGIADSQYDLVYTSNGVHVWINDLAVMYQSFNRVLREGGYYIYFETHPFIRPFDDSGSEVKVIKPYEDTGPFGDPPNYAWRIQDFMRALLASGKIYGQRCRNGSVHAREKDEERVAYCRGKRIVDQPVLRPGAAVKGSFQRALEIRCAPTG